MKSGTYCFALERHHMQHVELSVWVTVCLIFSLNKMNFSKDVSKFLRQIILFV